MTTYPDRACCQHLRMAGLTPFAALFYCTPSTYVFYDEEGRAHDVQLCSLWASTKP